MLTIEQLKLRQSGIGGSDLAGICSASLTGHGFYKTPLEIYWSKVDDTYYEQQDEPSQQQIIGSLKEPLLRELYTRQTGDLISTPQDIFRHPEYNWMIANIDGLIEKTRVIVELKSASEYLKDEWGEIGSDMVPKPYLLQAAHYAIVTDAPHVDICVLIGAYDFRIYKYHRNKSLEDRIIQIEHDFWFNHVMKMTPPKPINESDAKKMWQDADSNKKIATDDHIDMAIKKLRKIKSLRSRIDKIESDQKLIIQEYMKDAENLTDYQGSCIASWKNQSTTRIDVTSLKKEMGDLANLYSKTSTTRVFRLKGEK